MKQKIVLLFFCSLSITALWSRSVLIMDPKTNRPMIVEESSLQNQNLPFITQQAPQPSLLSQQQAPPPPPELAQMPNISFSQATRTQPGPSTGPFIPRMIPEMRGCLKIDGYDEKIPEFRICFNGKEVVSNNEGFYSIPIESTDMETFSLVMCRTFKQHLDKTNTIKNITIKPHKDYKCYTFKKNPHSNAWTEEETTIQDKNFVLPQNSIVVLIPPKYIDHLEAWNIKPLVNCIKLPTIVLKKEFVGKALERTSAKSLLYSLDKTVFHEPVKEIRKVDQANPKVCLSLMQ